VKRRLLRSAPKHTTLASDGHSHSSNPIYLNFYSIYLSIYLNQRLLQHTGAAAADGESAKRELLGARWIIPNETFYPLSFEVHGAASSSTHAFIERVACALYPDAGDFGGRRAAFTSMFRQRISVALQTANAQAIARWRRLSWSPRVVVGAGVAPV